MSKEIISGIDSLMLDAKIRKENSCGPVNLVTSCDLVIEMIDLIHSQNKRIKEIESTK